MQKLTINVPSTIEQAPHCEHYHDCGGCSLQHLSDDSQQQLKIAILQHCFKNSKFTKNAIWRPLLKAQNSWRYRNKVSYDFKAWQWIPKRWIEQGIRVEDQRCIGYYPTGVYDKVIGIDDCHLHSVVGNDIRNAIAAYAREKNLSFEDTRNKQGFLRRLIIRESFTTGEIMLILCVRQNKRDQVEKLFATIGKQFPLITSFYWLFSDEKKMDFNLAPLKLYSGRESLIEKLGDYTFQISPKAFFQVNTPQAEVLYRVIESLLIEKLPEGKPQFECIYDLYCGTGSIGIFVSKLAKKIIGIESVEPAVEDARINAKLNDVDNIQFIAGDMNGALSHHTLHDSPQPEVIILDPPRAGLHQKVIDTILEINSPMLIYVSCNAQTQARDCRLLQHRYAVEVIQGVDLMPQTEHIECVMLLVRK